MTINSLIEKSPPFKSYQIQFPKDHPFQGTVLTGTTVRPANLFFNQLFQGTEFAETPPGSPALFAFNAPHDKIRTYCKLKAPEEIVSFSAQGIPGYLMAGGHLYLIYDLSYVYGKNTYRMSYKEIQETLDSQKIFVSPLLPLSFYKALKKAMAEEGIVILPGEDSKPVLLKEMKGKIGELLSQAEKNPSAFGFPSKTQFRDLMQMTLYQIGSLVVKSEDYRVFVDGDGKIIERTPGQKDAVRLINACGIRGLNSKKTPQRYSQVAAEQMFKTALKAADQGIAIFPAVGMGVWKGNPDLYWRAFLNAVVASNNQLESILVQPGHQKTRKGTYKGFQGEEFASILKEYKIQFQKDPQILAKLNRISNLFKANKDIVQLAHNLKKAFPDKTISLLNASDPDVTLGYHVGEYVNNIPHTTTTEENYTAMGTNGLCFEGITGVHENPSRIIQVK